MGGGASRVGLRGRIEWAEKLTQTKHFRPFAQQWPEGHKQRLKSARAADSLARKEAFAALLLALMAETSFGTPRRAFMEWDLDRLSHSKRQQIVAMFKRFPDSVGKSLLKKAKEIVHRTGNSAEDVMHIVHDKKRQLREWLEARAQRKQRQHRQAPSS